MWKSIFLIFTICLFSTACTDNKQPRFPNLKNCATPVNPVVTQPSYPDEDEYYPETPTDPEPEETWWLECAICHGTGECQLCYGLGSCSVCGGTGALFQYGEWTSCGNCNGTGRCPSCDGSRACFACQGLGRQKMPEL